MTLFSPAFNLFENSMTLSSLAFKCSKNEFELAFVFKKVLSERRIDSKKSEWTGIRFMSQKRVGGMRQIRRRKPETSRPEKLHSCKSQ